MLNKRLGCGYTNYITYKTELKALGFLFKTNIIYL